MSASPIPIRRPSAPNTLATPVTFTPIRRNQTSLESPVERITPTRRQSALSASGAEQRQARRQDLRNFYGLKKEDVGSVNEGAEGVGDPLDIDSPAFNASAYYDDLISKSSLSGLMKTASSLSADIGNLHSSRHALVYNHHHQLFEAGDTISHLNSRTPQLLSIVTELQQSFSEISRLVDAVALPEESGAGLRDEGDGVVEAIVEKGMVRLRLLVLAEASPEEIRKCYEGFNEALEGAAVQGVEGMQGTVEESRKLLEALPSAPSSRGPDENRSGGPTELTQAVA